MALALFDLDNTLIAGDSDYLWGEFIVEQGLVSGDHYQAMNEQFYADYLRGELDMHAYIKFTAAPLTQLSQSELVKLQAQFLRQKIQPIRLTKAEKLIADHRNAGDTLLIITATNRFITGPIADELGIKTLLATELEMKDNLYTGHMSGEPCYQEGKILHLKRWLAEYSRNLEGSFFYSDSHNDLPLLSLVDKPYAVNPDETLTAHAKKHDWPILNLRT